MSHETDELSCSRTAQDTDCTMVVVLEMGKFTWMLNAIVPGMDRRPLKKLPVSKDGLLSQLHSWRDEAEKKSGCRISRICLSYEAGRDGFWLAHWLQDYGIEAHVMHPISVPVKREHRLAKMDRLDCQLLLRAYLGWLRGEEHYCRMVAVPTDEQQDARRMSRERKRLVKAQTKLLNQLKAMFTELGIHDFNPGLKRAPECLEELRAPNGKSIPPNALAEIRRTMDALAFYRGQIAAVEEQRKERIAQDQQSEHHTMVEQLATIRGLGLDTSDMLASELFFRQIPNRRALVRYGGLTGPPDESGQKRREKGLARAGNMRVRNGLIQLAWRFLKFQPDSELARWFRQRTVGGPVGIRKKMIVAVTRKLLVALWKFVTHGEVPEGVILNPAT